MEKGQNVNGIIYANMIKSGASSLRKNEKEVNDLNVFPIPDGDTGSNMLMTMLGGVHAIEEELSLSTVSRRIADGMLLGARGNSGVILSQFFNGIAKGFEYLDEATADNFYHALKLGVAYAYEAVVQPTEGTMLTVARAPLSNLKSKYENIESLFVDYIIEAKRVLAKTPDMLPVLKKAGVVDSGGAGLVYILEGMCEAICGDISELNFDFADVETPKSATVDFNLFTENDTLEFGYCTEVLLRLQTSKVDVNSFDIKTIIEYLTSIGDSVATVKTGSIVKIHVHTKQPYKALEKLQEFGEYLTVKIENMTLQHNEKVENEKETEKRERVPYAIVTTAMGKGIKELFENMGADAVIEGGQTNNPSSEEFIKAFDEVNADVIFVLPNNSNITMVAEQAGKIYYKSEIIVLPSKNLGQGYSAIAMLDYGVGDKEEIKNYLIDSMQGTVTAMVSKATKDTNMNNVQVVKGEYIGFTDKVIYTCNADKVHSAMGLLENFDIADKEYIILSYGADASEKERNRLRDALNEKYPSVEIYEVFGEQEVYDFMFIIE